MQRVIGYIRFDGIKGSSEEAAHKDWSILYSMQFGSTSAPKTSSQGKADGDANSTLHSIVVMKQMDAATPNIADKAANGVEFSKVEIDMVVNAGGNQSKTTMSYTFTKVYITSFVVSHQGTEGDDQNIFKEAITFDFATMIGKFTEVDDSGKTKGTSQFSWKVGKNTK